MSAGTCCFYLVLQSQFEASFMRVAAAIDDEGNYAWTVFNDYSGGDGRMDRAEFGTSAQEWCDGGPASCGDPVLDTTFATYDKNTDATIDSEEWLHMVDDDVIS
jgi:hypothetical protein